MTPSIMRYIGSRTQYRRFGPSVGYCSICQPVLNMSIRKLEDELNAAPFERGKTCMRVSSAAERVVIQFKHAFEEA